MVCGREHPFNFASTHGSGPSRAHVMQVVSSAGMAGCQSHRRHVGVIILAFVCTLAPLPRAGRVDRVVAVSTEAEARAGRVAPAGVLGHAAPGSQAPRIHLCRGAAEWPMLASCGWQLSVWVLLVFG